MDFFFCPWKEVDDRTEMENVCLAEKEIFVCRLEIAIALGEGTMA